MAGRLVGELTYRVQHHFCQTLWTAGRAEGIRGPAGGRGRGARGGPRPEGIYPISCPCGKPATPAAQTGTLRGRRGQSPGDEVKPQVEEMGQEDPGRAPRSERKQGSLERPDGKEGWHGKGGRSVPATGPRASPRPSSALHPGRPTEDPVCVAVTRIPPQFILKRTESKRLSKGTACDYPNVSVV